MEQSTAEMTPAGTLSGLATGRGSVVVRHTGHDIAVAQSPFSIPTVLPLLALLFLGTCAAAIVGVDRLPLAGGFAFIGIGLLGIAAAGRRGVMHLDDTGLRYEFTGRHNLRRVEESFAATWADIASVRRHPVHGLVLEIRGHTMSGGSIRQPGGLAVTADRAIVPLRLFSPHDRFVLDEVCDRLPEERWSAAASPGRRHLELGLALGTVVVLCTLIAVFAHWAI